MADLPEGFRYEYDVRTANSKFTISKLVRPQNEATARHIFEDLKKEGQDVKLVRRIVSGWEPVL